MGIAEFLFIFLVLAFSAPVAFVVCQAVGAVLSESRDGGTPCAPSRRANITASQPQTQRRIVYERTLGPPAGWHEPQHVAIVPAPARYDDDESDDIEDWDDELELVPVAVPVVMPKLAPIAVDDWPTRQTVEPEPVPVVVNSTAARFAALEFRR